MTAAGRAATLATLPECPLRAVGDGTADGGPAGGGRGASRRRAGAGDAGRAGRPPAVGACRRPAVVHRGPGTARPAGPSRRPSPPSCVPSGPPAAPADHAVGAQAARWMAERGGTPTVEGDARPAAGSDPEGRRRRRPYTR